MDPKYPTTRTGAALFLRRVAERLEDLKHPDYHDRKAIQLMEVLSELLINEARLEAWYADLGFVGCQGDEVCLSSVQDK